MNGEILLNRVRDLTGEHRFNRFDEINDAYKTLLTRAGMWISRVLDETTLEFRASTPKYSLPMHKIRRFEGMAVRASTDQKEWTPLVELTDPDFDTLVFQNTGTDGTDSENIPRNFRLIGGGEFEVNPVPSGTLECRLTYIGNPPDIDRSTEPILPEPYHIEIARMAAVALLFQTPTDSPDYEFRMDKATRLQGMTGQSYFPLANDISNNRSGVNFPKQKIMRT